MLKNYIIYTYLDFTGKSPRFGFDTEQEAKNCIEHLEGLGFQPTCTINSYTYKQDGKVLSYFPN
jgi:hypothetical protein